MIMNDLEIITLIKTTFMEYQRLKTVNKLYSDNVLPQSIIKLYYSRVEEAPFEDIIDKFKHKYIYNENKVENVKEEQEREGLGEVYDYIQNDGWKDMDNIYIICELHRILYSKVPFKEFGGAYRNVTSFLTNGGYNIADDYSLIPRNVYYLSAEYQNIVNFAEEIAANKSPNNLIKYIDMCLDFKCKVIKIHPFADGNGRTSRALLNIFFRRVNLPPTYVTLPEKAEYIKAMDEAIRCDNPSLIRQFYYYKICDSIYELDVEPRIKQEQVDSEKKQK